MDVKLQLTYEQVVEIVRQLPEEEKEKLRVELNPNPIEKLILEDFKEYDKVFRALA